MVNKLYVAVFVLLLLLAPVMAEDEKIDWKNILKVASYDANTQTIAVKDYLGLTKYETIKLVSNTEQCLTNCEMVKDITPQTKGLTPKEAIDNIAFVSKGGYDKVSKITYTVTYETTETYYENQSTWEKCDKGDKGAILTPVDKGTYQCIKETKQIEKQRIVLKSFYDLKELEADKTYRVHLTAIKPIGMSVDVTSEYGGQSDKGIWAWWNTNWTYCRDIAITTTVAWTNGIFSGTLTGLSGDINSIRIVNAACKDGGSETGFTILHNTSTTAEVTFLVNGTNPTYSVYYEPTSSQPYTAGGMLWNDEFDGAAIDTNKWIDEAEMGNCGVGGGNMTCAAGVQSYYHSNFTTQYGTAWTHGWQDINVGYGFRSNDWGKKCMIDEVEAIRQTSFSNTAEPAHVANWAGAPTGGDFVVYWSSEASGTCNGTLLGQDGGTVTGQAVDAIPFKVHTYLQYMTWEFVRIYPEYSFLYNPSPAVSMGDEESSSTPLSVTLNTPANMTNASASTKFNCSATSTTSYNIVNITFYHYKVGSTYTHTSTYAGNSSYEEKTLMVSGDGTSTWNCLAGDDSGATAWATSNRTFTIDTTQPAIYFEAGTTASGNQASGTIQIQTNASDTHYANTTINLYNSTGLYQSNFTTSTTSPLINILNLPDDTYYFNATANDNFGHHNTTETRTVVIDATQPNIYFGTGTTETGNQTSTSIIINVTASDANYANMTLYLAGTTIYSNFTTGTNLYWAVNGLADGTYKINATAFDTFGNSNSTETRDVIIDTIAPVVNVIAPANGSAIVTWIMPYNTTLNATQSDSGVGLGACWYGKNTTCYQEQANIATACGGLNTGIYNLNGNWNDADYSTFQTDEQSYYINYTKPSDYNNATWLIKDGVATTNYNIPQACFDYDATKVILKIDVMNAHMPTGPSIKPYCYGASGWVFPYTPFMAHATDNLYEEAIIWDNSNNTIIWDNSNNTAMTCNEAITTNYTTGGWHSVTFFANDTVGNTNAGNLTNFFLNYVIDGTPVYTSPIAEDAMSNPITFSMSATSVTSFTGFIVYNKTAYTTTVSFNSTTGTLYANPLESSSGDKEFYYNYTVNGINHLTANYTQARSVITPITVVNSEAGCGDLNKTNTFSFYDEDNRTTLDAETIKYNFVYGILNSSYKTLNGTLILPAGNISIYLCANVSALGNYILNYGELQYTKPAYSDNRYYFFTGTNLTANAASVDLYHLTNAKATSFLFTMTDTQLNVLANRYVALMHWYPEIDKYEITTMMRTDDKGQSVGRVIAEDVDYRVATYELNGTLIDMAAPIRFACTTTPCAYTREISITGAEVYSTILGIQSDITWNETSKISTLIYNDPSGSGHSIQFKITKMSGDKDVTVCDKTSTAQTDIIVCDLSAQTSGRFSAVAYRDASSTKPINSMGIEIFLANVLTGPPGLVIMAMIFILAAMLGMFNPFAGIIMSGISLMFGVAIHVLPYAAIGFFMVLAWVTFNAFKKVS